MSRACPLPPLVSAAVFGSIALLDLEAAPVAQAPAGPAFKRIVLSDQF
jgi:hypothetical protein